MPDHLSPARTPPRMLQRRSASHAGRSPSSIQIGGWPQAVPIAAAALLVCICIYFAGVFLISRMPNQTTERDRWCYLLHPARHVAPGKRGESISMAETEIAYEVIVAMIQVREEAAMDSPKLCTKTKGEVFVVIGNQAVPGDNGDVRLRLKEGGWNPLHCQQIVQLRS